MTATTIAQGCMANHSLFVKSDGSLWAMGDNLSGELGIGPPYSDRVNLAEQVVASNVTAIASGTLFTLFLESDGSLWGMGDNQYG